MTEWKGWWKCEKCDRVGNAGWRQIVEDRGSHYFSDAENCTGRLIPYDRRAPDPEKAELVKALRKARDHLEYCGYGDSWERECATSEGLPNYLDALLRRYEGGEG